MATFSYSIRGSSSEYGKRRAARGGRQRVTVADVVVVGAGPAGSYTAWALARTGANVVLLDRARFPRAKPCAEFLSPECSRILSRMGVLHRCEASRHALLAGMRIRSPNGTVIPGTYGEVDGRRPFREGAFSIRREVLDTILLEHAAECGAHVAQQTRVTELLYDGANRVCGVRTLDARGGSSGATREIRARVVVGADGLRSVVATRLSLRRRWPRPRRIGIVGHWEGLAGLDDYGEMHVEHDGYVGMADVGGGVANVSMVVPAWRAPELAGRAGGFYDEWLRARPQLRQRLRGARRIGSVQVTGPFATRTRRAWAPGVALVGDAAGYFDPFTGEGIYVALRGGELLAPRLLDALDSPDAASLDDDIRRYHRDFRTEMRPKLVVEGGIALFVSSPVLMNHAAAALTRRPEMADLLVGVCGDFVPPRQVLDPRYVIRLLALPFLPRLGGMPLAQRSSNTSMSS